MVGWLTTAENCGVQVSSWAVTPSIMTDSAAENLLKENGSDQNMVQSGGFFSGIAEAASGHLSAFCFIFSA